MRLPQVGSISCTWVGIPELRTIPHFRLMTDDAEVAFKEWAASPEKIRY
jgi:hypothetical protein